MLQGGAVWYTTPQAAGITVSNTFTKEVHMTTIMPQSELVRKAAQYIQEQMQEAGADLEKLMEEAGMRYNLSPRECELLRDFFTQASSQQS